MENANSNIEYYSKKKYQVYNGEIPKTLVKYIKDPNWKTFLDIGCGDGVLLHSLNMINIFEGRICYAVDLSKIRIGRASEMNPFAKCKVDDACKMKSIKDSSIDIAVSMALIEHVDNDKKAIKEIARVLRPGGIAYIETVFKKPWAWYFYKNNGKRVLEPNHVKEYTEDNQLLSIIKENKLRIVETQKQVLWYSLLDVFGHKTKMIKNTSKGIFSIIRMIKLPIIGYYNWKIICRKEY